MKNIGIDTWFISQYQCVHFALKSEEEFTVIEEHIVKKQLILVDLSEIEYEMAKSILEQMVKAAYKQESVIKALSTTLFLVIPSGIEIDVSEL